jgi:uncharacterized membrane-anchored protein
MAESDFSWLKIVSFFGAAVLLVLAFIMIACGIQSFTDSRAFSGVICLVSGALAGLGAWVVYSYYQRKSDEDRYGKR